jgi:hypothetical protein
MKSKIITSVRHAGSSHDPSASELAKQYIKRYSRMSKKPLLIAALLILASCSCKKNTTALSASLLSECPKDGDCKIELFDGKTMVVKTTDTGSLYYELEENASKKVLKYTYNRKVKGNIQDASYREEVIFELNGNEEKSTFVDNSLQDTQLLFGRFCYCKGQTGYYKIDSGSLTVSKDKETTTTQINLNFKTEKVPQIIKAIAISIK